MSQYVPVLQALVAEGIKKQLARERRYLSGAERGAIAQDAAAVAIAALIDLTGGPHHVVQSDGATFTLQHPLVERLTGDLVDCDVHDLVAQGEPLTEGRYRLRFDDAGVLVDLTPMKEYE